MHSYFTLLLILVGLSFANTSYGMEKVHDLVSMRVRNNSDTALWIFQKSGETGGALCQSNVEPHTSSKLITVSVDQQTNRLPDIYILDNDNREKVMIIPWVVIHFNEELSSTKNELCLDPRLTLSRGVCALNGSPTVAIIGNGMKKYLLSKAPIFIYVTIGSSLSATTITVQLTEAEKVNLDLRNYCNWLHWLETLNAELLSYSRKLTHPEELNRVEFSRIKEYYSTRLSTVEKLKADLTQCYKRLIEAGKEIPEPAFMAKR